MVRYIFIVLVFLISHLAFAQPGGGGNPLRPLNPPPEPAGNPVTTAKVLLGKSLFWDEQMSSTGTVACGTCHKPGTGGGDSRIDSAPVHPGVDEIFGTADDVAGSNGLPLNFDDGTYGWTTAFGIGEQVTGRRSPAATDAAYSNELFWDGRAGGVFEDPTTGEVVLNQGAALESQVLGPPVSSVEMGHVDRDWVQVAAKIANAQPLALSPSVPLALSTWIGDRSYPELFAEAFGTSEVSPARIAMAIASYERILYSDQTPLDAALTGGPALTQQETQGRNLFINRDCARCHGGPLLSDNQYHYIGVRPNNEDTGRFEVTGNNGDRGAFKTPGLRNVALRQSYFHNGQFDSLEEVVDFYDRGGDFNAPNKDPLIRPLNLTQQQKNALVAFLRRPLTDPRAANETAPFDRPALFSESNRRPVTGTGGISGAGGFTPGVMALEPPMIGNCSFTVGLDQARPGVRAVLVVDVTDPGLSATVPQSGTFAWEETFTQGNAPGEGYASVSLTIPDNPSLRGSNWFGRWYIEDPSAANGLAITPVFSFTLFQAGEGAPCPGDLNGDGFANMIDLVELTGEAGPCPVPCRGDLDGDGQVGPSDVRILTGGWKACQ